MPAVSASAPGKIILVGEHAVVYGQPAIAVPVTQVHARVVVFAQPAAVPGVVRIEAPQIDLKANLDELPLDHPLAFVIKSLVETFSLKRLPSCTIRISSTIPVASGLGSGAAVSIAILRALSTFLGQPLSDRVVNDLAYEVEKLHHGTPSGVDNTVIAYQQPVYYVRGSPIETLSVPAPFTFLIADTGIPSPTSITVGDVRKSYQDNPSEYAKMFAAIGKLVESARGAIERSDLQELGNLMDENHRYLSKLGVSSPELDRLVAIARQAGALGAKLSGGGRGGNMIALVVAEMAPQVVDALERGGAVNTITSKVESNAKSRDLVAGGA